MSWFLFHCKPKEDARAQTHIRNQGYDTYRPIIQVQRKRGGKIVWLEESLFPRYLFVNVADDSGNWRSLLSTRGIAGVVRFGEHPTKIPSALIEQIKVNERRLNQVEPVELFKKGETVLIVEGPFKMLEAIYQQTKGEDRVLVLLTILNQPKLVELNSSDIEPK